MSKVFINKAQLTALMGKQPSLLKRLNLALIKKTITKGMSGVWVDASKLS